MHARTFAVIEPIQPARMCVASLCACAALVTPKKRPNLERTRENSIPAAEQIWVSLDTAMPPVTLAEVQHAARRPRGHCRVNDGRGPNQQERNYERSCAPLHVACLALRQRHIAWVALLRARSALTAYLQLV